MGGRVSVGGWRSRGWGSAVLALLLGGCAGTRRPAGPVAASAAPSASPAVSAAAAPAPAPDADASTSLSPACLALESPPAPPGSSPSPDLLANLRDPSRCGSDPCCSDLVDGTRVCWLKTRDPVAPSYVNRTCSYLKDLGTACCTLLDGALACWRQTRDLTNPADFGRATGPVKIRGLTGVVELRADGDATCARLGDGTVRCWGSGPLGQAASLVGVPLLVPGVTGATGLLLGRDAGCALTASGPRCWGRGVRPPPSDDELQSRIEAAGCEDDASAIVAAHHAVAVLPGEVAAPVLPLGGDGSLPCALASGAVTCDGARLAVKDVVALETFSRSACALTRGGRVWCWGRNPSGQLGTGKPTEAPQPRPSQVPGLAGVTQLSGNRGGICALLKGGRVRCWGASNGGWMTGAPGPDCDGSCVATPTEVPGLTGVRQIAKGANHACALLADASVVCWGNNDQAQLGYMPGRP